MAVVGKNSVALGVSAIPHKHDLVWGWGGVGLREKLPFTVTPVFRAESCVAKMQTWLTPVGVCSDCAAAALSFR